MTKKFSSRHIRVLALIQDHPTQRRRDIAAELADSSVEQGNAAREYDALLKDIEKHKLVESRRVVLDRKKLGLAVTAFVAVRIRDRRKKPVHDYVAALKLIPNIQEIHQTFGPIDILLKVRARNHNELFRLIQDDIDNPDVVRDISTSIVHDIVKETTELPIAHLERHETAAGYGQRKPQIRSSPAKKA